MRPRRPPRVTLALVAVVASALPVGPIGAALEPAAARAQHAVAEPGTSGPPAVHPLRTRTKGTDASPASHQPSLRKISLFVFITPPPPPPLDWTPTQAEVDAAVEAKTGATAPGLPDSSWVCTAENYGESYGYPPPVEDDITPLRPSGSTLAFVAHPITNGLFVQYYACWPRS